MDNELRAWNHVGLFEPELQETDLQSYPRLARADDPARSIEDRARSYLDANCAYCHRPGGTVAYFDARYDTPLERQQLINGPVLINEGIDKPHVISPNDVWRSVALLRISSIEGLKMPPLAHETIDQHGVDLLREWIGSLPVPKFFPLRSSLCAEEDFAVQWRCSCDIRTRALLSATPLMGACRIPPTHSTKGPSNCRSPRL